MIQILTPVEMTTRTHQTETRRSPFLESLADSTKLPPEPHHRNMILQEDRRPTKTVAPRLDSEKMPQVWAKIAEHKTGKHVDLGGFALDGSRSPRLVDRVVPGVARWFTNWTDCGFGSGPKWILVRANWIPTDSQLDLDQNRTGFRSSRIPTRFQVNRNPVRNWV